MNYWQLIIRWILWENVGNNIITANIYQKKWHIRFIQELTYFS